jgi:hypothetical protein
MDWYSNWWREQRWFRDPMDPPLMRQLRKQQELVARAAQGTAFSGIAAWQKDVVERLEVVSELAWTSENSALTAEDVADALGARSVTAKGPPQD